MAKKQQPETYDTVPCSCGKHFGKGIWTAEKRAEVYAWYRDYRRKSYTPEMRKWMASYQRFHGTVKPGDFYKVV